MDSGYIPGVDIAKELNSSSSWEKWYHINAGDLEGLFLDCYFYHPQPRLLMTIFVFRPSKLLKPVIQPSTSPSPHPKHVRNLPNVHVHLQQSPTTRCCPMNAPMTPTSCPRPQLHHVPRFFFLIPLVDMCHTPNLLPF